MVVARREGVAIRPDLVRGAITPCQHSWCRHGGDDLRFVGDWAAGGVAGQQVPAWSRLRRAVIRTPAESNARRR